MSAILGNGASYIFAVLCITKIRGGGKSSAPGGSSVCYMKFGTQAILKNLREVHTGVLREVAEPRRKRNIFPDSAQIVCAAVRIEVYIDKSNDIVIGTGRSEIGRLGDFPTVILLADAPKTDRISCHIDTFRNGFALCSDFQIGDIHRKASLCFRMQNDGIDNFCHIENLLLARLARDLFQPLPADNGFCKLFFDFRMPGDWLGTRSVRVNIMIRAVSLQPSAVFLQKLDEVFSFHRSPSLHHYYTHLMRICQELFELFKTHKTAPAKVYERNAWNEH